MSTRTIRRLAAILAALRKGSPKSVAEISRTAGLPYATCHRLVQAMVHEQLLARDTATRRISLPSP